MMTCLETTYLLPTYLVPTYLLNIIKDENYEKTLCLGIVYLSQNITNK